MFYKFREITQVSVLFTIKAWLFTSICPFSSQLSQKRNVPEPQGRI